MWVKSSSMKTNAIPHLREIQDYSIKFAAIHKFLYPSGE